MKNFSILLLSSSLLACGGGSSSSEDEPVVNPVSRNVALSANGASVTSTYDEASALSVIDGDTTDSFFWSANITNDSFTIDFGSVVALDNVTIYTNDLSFSTSSPSKVVEVSESGTVWMTTSQIVGGDVPCVSSSTGSGSMFCEFGAPENIRYLRLTITSENSPELTQIYEIEAIGI